MDEDKISSDSSDKRKIEDDNLSPKPNTKRIKLVRPVFSPVAKSFISNTAEISKSDVQSTEIPKPNKSFMVEIPQTIEKSIDQPDIIKTPTHALETVKKTIISPLVSEEQVVSSSDDLQNIFSEETKKELEHLKKNILKIEDDGSSSENDSQSKRPRLKRPKFLTSATENKVESIDMKIVDKINETSKLDLNKSMCKENIIKIEKAPVIIKNDEKVLEENTSYVDKVKEEESMLFDNIKVEDESTLSRSIDKYVEETTNSLDIITEEIPILNENIIKIEKIGHTSESESTSENAAKIDEKMKYVEKIKDAVENPYEIINEAVEIKHVDTAIRLDSIKNDDPKQNMKKVLTDIFVEKEPINNGGDNQIVEEENNRIQKHMIEQVVILEEENEELFAEKVVFKECIKDNVRVILERCDDIKKEEVQVEKSISSIRHHNENKDNEKEKVNIKNDILVNEIIKTNIGDEVSNLGTENFKSNKTDQVNNDNTFNTDLLPNQNYEEHESQIIKSDILKAALMSKKSPEMLLNSLEMQDQLDANIHSTSIETKKTEILPKIGEEAIVNKIEAEIKLTNKDQLVNNTISQNKILCNVSEINTSKEISSSFGENITVDNHDEPPKWGSAKMNEVEKFLNDSNVTITPICKSQESPKLGKITLKLTKVGNPEIKSETAVRLNVKSELLKKITNKQISTGDSPLKSALSQPNKSFADFAIIRPAPKPSAEQIALLEQQILNTPKKRGRPSKALAQQKQLLLQYQQQQQKVHEGNPEDEPVFHVPLFDMEDMSGGGSMFDSFGASTPKKVKSNRGKGSRGRRGRGGGVRGRDGSDSDTTLNSRRMDDEGDIFHTEINQEEETKQVAMIEAERLRKEEERERKLEARKKKLKERNDAIKEKKMKKKQKAEERRLQWHEKKRLMQEEKIRAAEMKKSLPPPQNFDDETRMSADCNNSRSQTPARNFMMGEDDLSISCTTNDSLRMKKGRMEVIDLESNKTLTVDQIAEYQWPLEGGELYMIQEQISNFLGVKSFKRKYPGLKRRNVEAEERTFLCDSGLVAESLCDLGLTVLYSSEVLDIMYTDFPEKYEELREYMRLKHAKELTNRQRALMTISSNTDGSKLDLRDRAMEAVANWNVNLNKSRLESRKCSMDMQTFIVHYPKNKCKKMTVPKPKIGSYPLALLPGQFCDYYATYSSKDLCYLPMNTVMYGPLKSVDKDFPVSLSSQSESEDSSSDDSSDSDDSMEIDNKSGKNDLEYGPSDKKGAECKQCFGTSEKNKNGTVEPLIHCSKCLTIYHPTCLDMTLEMVPYIKRYNWQCNECKYCAQCKEVADEDKMLFCDLCDRGYHIYCVGLRRVPEGRWHCQECAMCSSCGVSDPGPGDSKWFYEFKKLEKTGSKVYCRTLCAPCSRSWKKGHYCPNCMRCYPMKNVERMTQCNSCDKYLHPECINDNTSSSNSQVVTCAICEEKAVSRLLTTVPRSLIKV